MREYYKRLLEERNELNTKINKLEQFVQTQDHTRLHEEQLRLEIELRQVLDKRLENEQYL